MLKTTTNLKNIFYEDKEIQDVMKKCYQIKRNLIFSTCCFKYFFKFFFVDFTGGLGKGFVINLNAIFPFNTSSSNCAICFSSPCISI